MIETSAFFLYAQVNDDDDDDEEAVPTGMRTKPKTLKAVTASSPTKTKTTSSTTTGITAPATTSPAQPVESTNSLGLVPRAEYLVAAVPIAQPFTPSGHTACPSSAKVPILTKSEVKQISTVSSDVTVTACISQLSGSVFADRVSINKEGTFICLLDGLAPVSAFIADRAAVYFEETLTKYKRISSVYAGDIEHVCVRVRQKLMRDALARNFFDVRAACTDYLCLHLFKELPVSQQQQKLQGRGHGKDTNNGHGDSGSDSSSDGTAGAASTHYVVGVVGDMQAILSRNSVAVSISAQDTSGSMMIIENDERRTTSKRASHLFFVLMECDSCFSIDLYLG